LFKQPIPYADCFRPLRSGRSISFFDEQFSGVNLSPRPGTPVKDYWQVEPDPKIIVAPALFRKSWNKNTRARLYVNEYNHSFTAAGTVKS
jgi:hypothetical protein